MKLEFSVYRYNPDVDDAPRMQDYTLEAEEGRDMMLLDALMQLKEKDPSLSFRRSCREGVCGSDGLNMNGKNGLACITPISALNQPGKKIVIRPLPGLPVVRDLVVDMGQFYAQYEKIKPFLLPQSQRIEIRMLMTAETIGVNELQDFNLLHIGIRVGNRRRVTWGNQRLSTEIITCF
jgi:succinate dehydrogenase / fumarate reductase, iron-sulfur subunit